jgi:outer membrane immunogenic protein
MAADMPMKAPPAPVLLYDWSGLYVGASIGGMWYDINRTFPNASGLGGFGPGPGGNFTTSGSDAIFDMHAGFQGQWGNWVLGLEFGYSACFNECRLTSGVLPVAPAGAPLLFTPNTSAESKLTQLATIGPRLGWAWDRFLIYGTGGWASANLKGTYCSTVTGVCGPFVTPQNGSTWNQGWFAGGGVEWMVHRGALVDVILGVEYQHFDVSNHHDRAFCFTPACVIPTGADYDLDAKGDIVRARLTIKTQGYGIFGAVGKAPVAAPYPTK